MKKLVVVIGVALGAIAIRALLRRPPSRAEELLEELESHKARIERLDPWSALDDEALSERAASLKEMCRLLSQLNGGISNLDPKEHERLEELIAFIEVNWVLLGMSPHPHA